MDSCALRGSSYNSISLRVSCRRRRCCIGAAATAGSCRMPHHGQEVSWEAEVLVPHALPHLITQLCHMHLLERGGQAEGSQLQLHNPAAQVRPTHTHTGWSVERATVRQTRGHVSSFLRALGNHAPTYLPRRTHHLTPAPPHLPYTMWKKKLSEAKPLK